MTPDQDKALVRCLANHFAKQDAPRSSRPLLGIWAVLLIDLLFTFWRSS